MWSGMEIMYITSRWKYCMYLGYACLNKYSSCILVNEKNQPFK